MSEFVKKTIVGYKDVSGGSSDPDCTHVILTLNEYKKIVRERDEAIRTVRRTADLVCPVCQNEPHPSRVRL